MGLIAGLFPTEEVTGGTLAPVYKFGSVVPTELGTPRLALSPAHRRVSWAGDLSGGSGGSLTLQSGRGGSAGDGEVMLRTLERLGRESVLRLPEMPPPEYIQPPVYVTQPPQFSAFGQGAAQDGAVVRDPQTGEVRMWSQSSQQWVTLGGLPPEHPRAQIAFLNGDPDLHILRGIRFAAEMQTVTGDFARRGEEIVSAGFRSHALILDHGTPMAWQPPEVPGERIIFVRDGTMPKDFAILVGDKPGILYTRRVPGAETMQLGRPAPRDVLRVHTPPPPTVSHSYVIDVSNIIGIKIVADRPTAWARILSVGDD